MKRSHTIPHVLRALSLLLLLLPAASATSQSPPAALQLIAIDPASAAALRAYTRHATVGIPLQFLRTFMPGAQLAEARSAVNALRPHGILAPLRELTRLLSQDPAASFTLQSVTAIYSIHALTHLEGSGVPDISRPAFRQAIVMTVNDYSRKDAAYLLLAINSSADCSTMVRCTAVDRAHAPQRMSDFLRGQRHPPALFLISDPERSSFASPLVDRLANIDGVRIVRIPWQPVGIAMQRLNPEYGRARIPMNTYGVHAAVETVQWLVGISKPHPPWPAKHAPGLFTALNERIWITARIFPSGAKEAVRNQLQMLPELTRRRFLVDRTLMEIIERAGP